MFFCNYIFLQFEIKLPSFNYDSSVPIFARVNILHHLPVVGGDGTLKLDALSQVFDFAMDDGDLAPGDNDDTLDDAGVEDGFNSTNELAAYVDVDCALLQLLTIV